LILALHLVGDFEPKERVFIAMCLHSLSTDKLAKTRSQWAMEEGADRADFEERRGQAIDRLTYF